MESTWVVTTDIKKYPQLEKDIHVDAAIVGGGITGTTAAYYLAKAGAKVALIDKGVLKDSVSAYTTAFIRYIVDSRLVELRDLFGADHAKNIWQSSKDAVEMIRQNVSAENIDCEYLPCAFHKFGNDDSEWKELASDLKLAREYGFDVQEGEKGGIRPKNAGYLTIENQAKFHTLKYLAALREKAVEAGALIFEDTEAKELSEKDPLSIRTPKGTVGAKRILVATYSPFHKPAELFAHKGIYITYVMEMEVPKDAIPEAMYEDNGNPYHYLRADRHSAAHDRVILGGEDHRQELPFDPRKAYAALREYFEKTFPDIPFRVVRTWSGPIIETIDGLPYIGTYSDAKPDVFVATGFSGSGMTFGTLAGYMFSEFAQGRPTPWKDTYDPRRRITARQFWGKAKDYFGEFVNAYAKNVLRRPAHKLLP